jgi:hypothetical protein
MKFCEKKCSVRKRWRNYPIWRCISCETYMLRRQPKSFRLKILFMAGLSFFWPLQLVSLYATEYIWGRDEIQEVYLPSQLERTVHCNSVRDGIIEWMGVGVHSSSTPARADFSIMMECTPEIGYCHSVCTLCSPLRWHQKTSSSLKISKNSHKKKLCNMIWVFYAIILAVQCRV